MIPENEVAGAAGVALDARSNGTVTDEFLQTSLPGVFSCGNSHGVMDLVDFVSEQGEIAGHNAAAFSQGQPLTPWNPTDRVPPAKGVPKEGSVICPLCPNGCCLHVGLDGTVTGNRCPRGKAYAQQEQREPMRILTTTVRGPSGCLLPVKTDRPIPRAMILQASSQLRTLKITAHVVHCGDALLKDICGANIIATRACK